LDKKWPTFFCETNIPFNVVWHLIFLEVVKTTLEFQPIINRHCTMDLCINMLKKSKVNVFKLFAKRTWNFIHKYGTTICLDGWNNVAKHPMLNMIFNCCNGDVFLGVINMRDHNDAHYICNALVGYIKIVRMDKIIQIFISNVSNM
jgi:hypothetical protein